MKKTLFATAFLLAGVCLVNAQHTEKAREVKSQKTAEIAELKVEIPTESAAVTSEMALKKEDSAVRTKTATEVKQESAAKDAPKKKYEAQ